MKAKFEISEEDYVRAMKLSGRMTLRHYFVDAVCIFVLIGFIFFGNSIIRSAGYGGLIGGSAWLIIRSMLIPITARRHYRKYKSIHDTFYVEIEDDGLSISSSSGSGKIKWDVIHKWRSNDEYVLIYVMQKMFHIIPASISNQGFSIQRLKEKLESEVGQAA